MIVTAPGHQLSEGAYCQKEETTSNWSKISNILMQTVNYLSFLRKYSLLMPFLLASMLTSQSSPCSRGFVGVTQLNILSHEVYWSGCVTFSCEVGRVI